VIHKTAFPLLAGLLFLAPTACSSAASQEAWMSGTWTATSDEDGTPADIFDFTADGKYVNYGIDCAVRSEMPYHVYAGDIYISIELEKGPISIVFRPSADKTKLTFTSPRTRNNAVYERLRVNPCTAKS
jgi:hypothetical protein